MNKKYKILIVLTLLMLLTIMVVAIFNNSKKQGNGTAGISKEEFEEIKLGMSQSEVNGIIDKLDEWNNDDVYDKCCEEVSSSNSNHIYTYQYKYYGENGGYALITYEADYSDGSLFKMPEVVKKENINLN